MPAETHAKPPAPRWDLSAKVSAALPEGYAIRRLRDSDFEHGYLECLGQLTLVGDVSREAFCEQLAYMEQRSDTYTPVVVTDHRERVVASGTLVTERKFIHDCGMLAHIEDIVVCADQRGRGLGRLIVQQLKHLAHRQGCYKITLDCEVENEPFYSKSDFVSKGLQMCIYFRDNPATTPASPKYPLHAHSPPPPPPTAEPDAADPAASL